MEEIWKDIPNFNGYQASCQGRIFSQKRNKVLKTNKNEKGYLRVNLSVNGKRTSQRVNRLIAMTFLDNPDNLPEVNHKNGNKEDNTVNNLEWCTHLYNMQEAYKNNQIPPRKANKTSFTPKQVLKYDLDNNLLNKYNTLSEASKLNNINPQTLSRYCLNQRKSKDYIWRYADK